MQHALLLKSDTQIKCHAIHLFCLSPRLDPGSASSHDPVSALLLLLPHCVFISAVQTGQGRTLLLHCHLPDLSK